MHTLVNAARTDYYHRNISECIEKIQKALELGNRVDDPSTQVEARYTASRASLQAGDLEGARQHIMGRGGLALFESVIVLCIPMLSRRHRYSNLSASSTDTPRLGKSPNQSCWLVQALI